MYLVITLIFITPLNISAVYGTENDGKKSVQTVGECRSKGFKFNVKESLLFSILTLCIPGILERLYEWKQIKCKAVKCYYDAIVDGINPEYCKTVRSYEECVFVVQDLLLGQIVEYFRKIVDTILKDPIFFAVSIGVYLTRKFVKANCCAGGGTQCMASAVALASYDIVGTAMEIKSIFENFGEIFNPRVDDYCDDIDEIKEKAMEILGEN